MSTTEIFQVLAIVWFALGYVFLVQACVRYYRVEKKFGEGPFAMIIKGPIATRITAMAGAVLISPLLAAFLPIFAVDKVINGAIHIVWPPLWVKKPVKGKVIAAITANGSISDREPPHILVEVVSEPEGDADDPDAFVVFKATVFSTTKDKVQMMDANGTIKWANIRIGDPVLCSHSKLLGNRLIGEEPEEFAA